MSSDFPETINRAPRARRWLGQNAPTRMRPTGLSAWTAAAAQGDGQRLTVTGGPPGDQDCRTHISPRIPTSPAEHGLKQNICVGFTLKVRRTGTTGTGPNNQSSGQPHRIDCHIIGAGGNLRGHRSFLQRNRGKSRERRGTGLGRTAGQQQS